MNRFLRLGCLPLLMMLVPKGALAQASGDVQLSPATAAPSGSTPGESTQDQSTTQEPASPTAPVEAVPSLAPPTAPPTEQDQNEATEARLESMLRADDPNERSPSSAGEGRISESRAGDEDLSESSADDQDLTPPTPPPDEAFRFSALAAIPLAGTFNPFLRLQQEYDIQPAELGGFRVGFRLAETIGQAWFLHAGGLLSAEYEWFTVDDFRVMAAISVSIGAMFGQLGTRVDTLQFDVMPALDIRCLWDPDWDLGLRVGAGISLVNTLDVGLTWAVRF